jgi:integrase/recombinase XerD
MPFQRPKNLLEQNVILHNPASELELPRMEKRLPTAALSLAQMDALLAVPNVADPLGVRDRAMLELFYSCVLRRAELCRLELSDLNTERRTLTIRKGKGKKDRVVPVGLRAIAWLERYLQEVRPRLCLDTRTPALFLTGYGEAFNPDVVSRMVAGWIKKVTGRVASCHLLRHTCATHMLEGGADIRYIQQLLGHEKLETTAIYTEVSIKQLQEVHTRCHPSARSSEPEIPACNPPPTS